MLCVCVCGVCVCVRDRKARKHAYERVYVRVCVICPLGGEVDDSVELALQGAGALAHLDVLAVGAAGGDAGLGLLQRQQLGGGGAHQQRLGPRQGPVT